MPIAYRLVKARHARTAFTGEGARIAGGRWTRPGDPVVYTSDSLALAAIETFVHLGEDRLHIRFVYFKVDIPDDVRVEQCRRPPRGWRAEPPLDASMRYGSSWIRRGQRAVLDVPSVIVPSERNYLLKPRHPEFARIRIGRPPPSSSILACGSEGPRRLCGLASRGVEAIGRPVLYLRDERAAPLATERDLATAGPEIIPEDALFDALHSDLSPEAFFRPPRREWN